MNLACDLCGRNDARFVLRSHRLDGPLVECRNCGLKYIGERQSQLTFADAGERETVERVRAANADFRHLRLEEERRLALLNASWRLGLIREMRSSGKLLEIGCARGDFLKVARDSFDVYGVEPNPELAISAESVAPIYRGLIETLPWKDFDIAASFHVIEHVDSPSRFVAAIGQRLKPGGVLVLETPDVGSLAFRLMRARWRQFIPEHYYFFDRQTLSKLLTAQGFRVIRIERIGKHASAALVANRLSRYFQSFRRIEDLLQQMGVSRVTMRVNPFDIMIAFATRVD